MQHANKPLDKLYGLIANEEDARICKGKAVFLLATGALTALISTYSNVAVILVLGLIGLAGEFSAMALSEVTLSSTRL